MKIKRSRVSLATIKKCPGLLALVGGLCLLASARHAMTAEAARPNFLMIAIDDLNTFSGYAAEEPGNFLQVIYPDPKVRAEVVKRLTPNIDRLASQSAPFVRSYCASALCGPSRTSLMTGIAPHKSGYYMHDRNFRLYESLTNAVTLPQQLKANGYFTTGVGKLFHTGHGTTNGPIGEDWADARNSWSVWVNHAIGCNGGQPGKYSPPNGGLMQFGPSRLKTEEAGDWLVADYTARLLEHGTATIEASRGESEAQTVTLPESQPFFVGCGLFRPHLPFYAPKEFFDKFPTAEMTGLNRAALDGIVAGLTNLPPSGMRFSDYDSAKKKMSAVMTHARELGGQEAEIAAWRDLVQSYLACVSFADTCIGRVLDGYEKSPRKTNTVIVLWSDHGFHVGSKYHVAKQAQWEEANRTEFIIHDPCQPASCNGQLRRQLVSLNDIYPTICALAGVPLPKTFEVGNNLAPLLANAAAPELHPEGVLMTYMAGNHTLRTPQYSLIRYRAGDMELYDAIKDPFQLNNLAGRPEMAALRNQMAVEMSKRVAGEVLSGDGDAAAADASDNDAGGTPKKQRRKAAADE